MNRTLIKRALIVMRNKWNEVVRDKVRGCLVWGAVGDALGYAVEFMNYRAIVAKYGDKGITRYELNSKGVAEISDDTQMTLYTANGLLIDDVKTAYLEWYQTQNSFGQLIHDPKCILSKEPGMYLRRAPGNTCLSALYDLAHGREADNNSKGCGGIMRVAPYGLYYAHRYSMDCDNAHSQPFDKTAKMACEAARLTHKHPMGFLPAGLLAATIQYVIEETQHRMIDGDYLTGEKRERITKAEFIHCIRASLHAIIYLCKCTKDYPNWQEADELVARTNQAIALADETMADVEAIRSLGEGWTGDEAWYIAVYCAVKHFDNPEQAIIAAVNHSGDSDSTGAICGNLIGAVYGYTALPEHFIQNLELHDAILSTADNLVLAGL